MGNLYEKIESLCSSHKVSITKMCRDSGISRAPLSDLKMGRSKTLSSTTVSKIAAYFGVSVDYLLSDEEKETLTSPKVVSDEDIKFALFGEIGVSDEDYADVKRYAEFIKNKKKE